MALSESFVEFLRETVISLGFFGKRYVSPLSAFLSMAEEPESIHEVLERGLTVDFVKARLEEILSQDAFLARCCGDKERLAFALDVLFFRRLPDRIYDDSGLSLLNIPTHPIDAGIMDLEHTLYRSGEFSKKAFFHLFNFSTSNGELPPPPYPGWSIENLDSKVIPHLLGESTFSSFLSPPSTGTFFLVVNDYEGFDSESLQEWLSRRWQDAFPFRQILQYAKDAIIDFDYVVPYFSPPWVNQIQRGGLYYLGSPRQDQLPTNLWYLLLPGESEEIQLLWRLYQKHAERIMLKGSSLRKAIGIAGDFYEDSHRKVSRTEQFADLMISLEALFTPSDQTEHTYRISQSCALLLGDTSDSRETHYCPVN